MVNLNNLKTLSFQKQQITFARWEGEYVIPALFLGKAIGYSKNGETLTNLLRTTWKKKFVSIDVSRTDGDELALNTVDAVMLTGSALAEFKNHMGLEGNNAPQLLILTASGLTKVLTRSRSKTAVEFRNFIAKNGRELLGGRELKAKKLGKAFKKGAKVPDQKVLPLISRKPANSIEKLEDESSINDIFRITKEMSKNGLLSKNEHKQVLKKVLEVKMVKFSKENGVTHFLNNPDGTVSATKTSALAKSAVAMPEGSFNLATREEQFHPDFLDWLPASEIGRPFGLKGDLVKKYMKRICEQQGVDLPNNDAKRIVELNGGKFPDLDEKGFIVYRPQHGLGFAMVMKMEGNALNWRNYWSPEVVKKVRQEIMSERKLIAEGTGERASTPVQLPVTVKEPVVIEGTATQLTQSASVNGG